MLVMADVSNGCNGLVMAEMSNGWDTCLMAEASNGWDTQGDNRRNEEEEIAAKCRVGRKPPQHVRRVEDELCGKLGGKHHTENSF